MQREKYYVLFFMGIILLVLSIFAIDNNLSQNITSSKRCCYYLIVPIIGISSITSLNINNRKILRLNLVDLLFASLVIWIVMVYDYKSNPAPHLLAITVLSLPLFFFIKDGLKLGRRVSDMIELIFGVMLIYISYIGIRQMFGFESSYHSNYKVTGPFFNPGPYGGFIAILQPMILWNMLKYESIKPKRFYTAYSIIGKIYQCAFWISMIVLPSTMSRTAWIASIVGMELVIVFRYGLKNRILEYVSNNRKFAIAGISAIVMISGIMVFGAYNLKADSANGRVFMWKISLNAIKESPITGSGLGGFPKSYAKAQHDYFADSIHPENMPESRIAGTPEYGFNEYLQIAIELGIPGLLLFLSILLVSMRYLIKEREIGLAGSLLAFMIFAFASYPLRVLPFHVILIPILALASVKTEKTGTFSISMNRGNGYFMTSLMVLSLVVFYNRRHEYNSYKEFRILKYFDVERGDESLVRDYEALYKHLNYEPEYLLNYGKLLAVKERYEESNEVLRRGTEVSGDPMFYNLMGKNYQAMGEYKKAEDSFVYSHTLLPNRFYPLYLMVKMYSEENCFEKSKIIERGNQIINKDIKIHSTAIKEMQREVKQILSQYEEDNKIEPWRE